MAYQRLSREFICRIENNDFDAACKIHTENPKMLNHPECSVVRCFLLSKSAICNNVNITELIVNSFKDIQFCESDNLKTYLDSAIYYHNLPLVEFLLNKGAKLSDLKWTDYSMGWYIFNKKHMNTRRKMLELLIHYDLETKIHNRDNENLLQELVCHYVEKDDHDAVNILIILVNAGLPFNKIEKSLLLQRSIHIKNINLVTYLVNAGSDININVCGYTALTFAAEFGSAEIVDLLLSKGADFNGISNNGFTALHFACKNSDERMISCLLKNGANISAINENGETPFSLLDPGSDNYKKCAIIMIKEFAKLSIDNPPVNKCDRYLIDQNDNEAYENFRNCLIELVLMARVKFYNDYSYYQILNMSKNIEELANLTYNDEFLSGFEANLGKFSYYANDLQRILIEAIHVRDELLINNVLLCDLLNDSDREFAHDLTNEDLPME